MRSKMPGESLEQILRGIAAHHKVSLERAAAMLIAGIRRGANRLEWEKRLDQKPHERN